MRAHARAVIISRWCVETGLELNKKEFSSVDGNAYNADKAYKDSKLCNILFAKELERRCEDAGSKIRVNAFGPGLITRTGFFRNQNPIFTALFDFATNDIFHVAATVDEGGDCLVYMATSASLEGVGGEYFNNNLSSNSPGGHLFAATETSDESEDGAEAKKLWMLSEQLVGL